MPKDKLGNQLTWKEFFQRWKQGMEEIEPLSQTKVSLIGNVIVVIGVISGLITMSMAGIWWVVIILIGSLFLTGISLLGTLQNRLYRRENW